MIAAGRAREVRRAIRVTRWRRVRNAWLRGSRNFGEVMSALWLTLAYFAVVGPFALIARFTERTEGGFVDAPPAHNAASQA